MSRGKIVIPTYGVIVQQRTLSRGNAVFEVKFAYEVCHIEGGMLATDIASGFLYDSKEAAEASGQRMIRIMNKMAVRHETRLRFAESLKEKRG